MPTPTTIPADGAEDNQLQPTLLLRYFVETQDGFAVPLVQADQLHLVKPSGIPGKMLLDDAYELGMQCVGRISSNTITTTISQSQHAISNGCNTTTTAPAQSPHTHAEHIQTDKGTEKKIKTKILSPNTHPKSSDKTLYKESKSKRYCTYWIHRGECDFMQQGCQFVHEMPDLDTLHSIGFRSVPNWYKLQQFESASATDVPATLQHSPSSRRRWRNTNTARAVGSGRKEGSAMRKTANAPRYIEASQPSSRSTEPSPPARDEISLLDLSPVMTPITTPSTDGSEAARYRPQIKTLHPQVVRTGIGAPESIGEIDIDVEDPRDHIRTRVVSPVKDCLIRRSDGRTEAWIRQRARQNKRSRTGRLVSSSI